MSSPYNEQFGTYYQPEPPQPDQVDPNRASETDPHAPTVPHYQSYDRRDYTNSYAQPDPMYAPSGYQQPGSTHSSPTQAFVASPSTPARKSSRTGLAVLVTLLLAVIFGGLMFGAGWEYGRGNSAASPYNPGSLQSGSNSSTAPIPPLTGNNITAVREAVIAKVKPAVVRVDVTTGNGGAIGSGVIIDKRGYIVTNNHVVAGAQGTITVLLSNGTKLAAQLAGTDPADDLAVLKVNPPANMVTITVGDSSKLQVGQDVLAIGNPLGINQTVTNGIVSALNRTVSEGQGGATIPNAIQTDAPINPGNSGGALVDLQGNLVGIPTLTAIDPEFNTPASGVGFAIPSNRVNYIVPQIIQNGKVLHTGRAVLGIQATSVDASIEQQDNLSVDHGVLIAGLVANGAAAKAGLQTGDVIVKIDNQDITDLSALQDALISKNPGDTVSVQVYRGNQQLTVNVTLGELQAGS